MLLVVSRAKPPLALLGEPLSVELVNTVVRDAALVDLLTTPAELDLWLAAHDLSSTAEATLGPLRSLRDGVRELFDARLSGAVPSRETVDELNDHAAKGVVVPTLSWPGDGPVSVDAGPQTVEQVIGVVARDAIAVLSDPTGLRRCDGPGCVLMFVPANRRRRWCASQRCGNRVRVARHQESPGRIMGLTR